MIQAWPRFHLATPQKTKEDQGVLMYAEGSKACHAFVLLYCTLKIPSAFLTSFTAPNSERSLQYCKHLQEGYIYRRIYKISSKMSVSLYQASS